MTGERLILTFSPQSGQILTIEDPVTGVKLFNKAGVIHWNPDVFIPGIAWDHSFDWNPPRDFAERTGPLVYLNARKGPMPRIKDVFLEVKYTLEKDAPYFIAETRTRVDRDLGVIALRNDEMVLFKELFDTLVYKTPGGDVVQMPLKEMPDRPFGLAHITPVEPDWVGLVHSQKGYGFFSLRLETSVSNLDIAGGMPLKAGDLLLRPLGRRLCLLGPSLALHLGRVRDLHHLDRPPGRTACSTRRTPTASPLGRRKRRRSRRSAQEAFIAPSGLLMEFVDFAARRRGGDPGLIFPGWTPGETVAFLSPHDDDAVLGAGCLIQAVAAAGGNPLVLVFCRGDAGYTTVEAKAAIVAVRREETLRAYTSLGVGESDILSFDVPDFALLDTLARRPVDPPGVSLFDRLIACSDRAG